jgi:hypothetical protein
MMRDSLRTAHAVRPGNHHTVTCLAGPSREPPPCFLLGRFPQFYAIERGPEARASFCGSSLPQKCMKKTRFRGRPAAMPTRPAPGPGSKKSAKRSSSNDSSYLRPAAGCASKRTRISLPTPSMEQRKTRSLPLPQLLRAGQHVLPGGQVCSGFFSLAGRAVLPVTSPVAGRGCAGAAVPGDVCPGEQFAPTGHVASGFPESGRFGAAVCADTAPAANTRPVIRPRRSLGIIVSTRTSFGEVHAVATERRRVGSTPVAGAAARPVPLPL